MHKIKEKLIPFLKQHKPVVIICAVLVLAASGAFAYIYAANGNIKENPDPTFTKTEPPKPTTLPSPLTGVEVAPELANRPVTGVMIENSPDARPQSSLSQAGLVFEAVAEGGITRFLALYQEAKPKNIGPVRSLRPYYLDWGMGFDAPIAHVGGSGQALQLVQARKAKDLDQFGAGNSFWRASDRYAPHNVYTSAKNLDALNKARSYTSSKFKSFPRKDAAVSETPTASTITVDFSGPLYAVNFKYNKESNNYGRSLAGAPHIDRETGKQIRVKNVVVVKMPTTYNGSYAVMPTIGKGEAVIFRDGTAIKGTWRQKSYGERIEFLDAEGKEIELNRGNTWIAVNPTHRPFSYR